MTEIDKGYYPEPDPCKPISPLHYSDGWLKPFLSSDGLGPVRVYDPLLANQTIMPYLDPYKPISPRCYPQPVPIPPLVDGGTHG